MLDSTSDSIDSLISKEMSDYDTFPGAELLITSADEVLKHDSYGYAQQKPVTREMEKGTLFDLASLTKVIATTTASLILLEEGAWRLEDPLHEHLPRLGERDFTIKHLLTHTAGLPPWVDLFSSSADAEEALELLYSQDWPISTSVLPPGERVVYSDIGFMLLGKAVEEVSGLGLDVFARRHIFKPLGMDSTCFCPSAENGPIAATEEVSSRGGVIVGEVHDENASALGGVAGHAGVFSTAEDLGKFARALLRGGGTEEGKILSRASIELMASTQTAELGSDRGLGWKLQGDSSPEAGDLFSPQSYGHTGFTGTSLWIDPESELAVVLLTNRVHPSRSRGSERIHQIRARIHNCAAAGFGR